MNHKYYFAFLSIFIFSSLFVISSAAQPMLPDEFNGTVELGGSKAKVGTEIKVTMEDVGFLKKHEITERGKYSLYVKKGSDYDWWGKKIYFFVEDKMVGHSSRGVGRKNLNLSLSPTNTSTGNYSSLSNWINFSGKGSVGLNLNIRTNKSVDNTSIEVFTYEDGVLGDLSVGDNKSHIRSLEVNLNNSIVDYVIIKAYYNESSLGTIFEETINLYRYNESSGDWNEVESTVYPEDNYIEANVSQFSTYGLFGRGPECGDGVCNGDETCSSCSEDCGECSSDGGDDDTSTSGTSSGGFTLTSDCEENWTCSDWGDCIDETQTRTCTDLNECGAEENKPKTEQSCCVPDWDCTNWSECENGTQTRDCSLMNDCDFEERPIEEKGCEETCEPNWIVVDKSECVNGSQTVEYLDINECNTTETKPHIKEETESCTVSDDQTETEDGDQTDDTSPATGFIARNRGNIIAGLVILVIAVGFLLYWRKKG